MSQVFSAIFGGAEKPKVVKPPSTESKAVQDAAAAEASRHNRARGFASTVRAGRSVMDDMVGTQLKTKAGQ